LPDCIATPPIDPPTPDAEPDSLCSEAAAAASSLAPDLPLETLATVFGYSEFRSHQREIIEHVVAGGSAFVLMPTGGGKSLCFQIPALLRDGRPSSSRRSSHS